MVQGVPLALGDLDDLARGRSGGLEREAGTDAQTPLLLCYLILLLPCVCIIHFTLKIAKAGQVAGGCRGEHVRV